MEVLEKHNETAPFTIEEEGEQTGPEDPEAEKIATAAFAATCSWISRRKATYKRVSTPTGSIASISAVQALNDC